MKGEGVGHRRIDLHLSVKKWVTKKFIATFRMNVLAAGTTNKREWKYKQNQ